MTDRSLPPIGELERAPGRRGFRVAPPGWSGPADAESPEFAIDAAELWRAWIAFAARQPRTVLQAQDERARRSLHVQRSAMLRFPDLVRGEIVALEGERSGLILDSRARFGFWDLGVNRRRVLRWVHDLGRVVTGDRPDRPGASDPI